METRSKFLRMCGVLTAIAVLSGCHSSGGSSTISGTNDGEDNLAPVATPKSALTFAQVPSCSAFKDYVADSIADLVLNVGMLPCPGCVTYFATRFSTDPAIGTAGIASEFVDVADAAEFSAFTGTNNQETGVDELDQIEADANGNFYIADGNHIVVANGLPPAELREIATLEIEADRQPVGLLLDADNDRLVVVLSQNVWATTDAPTDALIARPFVWNPVTELMFVDVADPASPVVERRLKIDGYHLAARRIGGRVHLVSHATPTFPVVIAEDAELLDLSKDYRNAVTDGDEALADTTATQIRARVAALVATIEVGEFLPALGLAVGSEEFVDITSGNCADIAVPDASFALALTSITSVDSDGTNVDSLTLVNSSWNVYASADNLYLSQLSSSWWWSDRQQQQTALYKIAIGAGAPQFVATGLVDGWTGSSFQFSEHDGYLRVVTTRAHNDPSTAWFQDHALYVLADNYAGSLDVLGSVEGFGAGETIFSTRLIGNRGFVVTFRQIDPLFAFDLSIPWDPKLVGELEIPGVSTYLHPLDDTHLLTIGFDGNDNRLNGNFQLQIFDVQNLDDPRLVHKYVPSFAADGFAWTVASYDHLAFNYFPEGGTLTVPLQYYASDLDSHFSGFMAFSVSTLDGFAELGRLDHSDLARAEYCTDSTQSVPSICSDGTYLAAATPRRSVSAQFEGETYIYTLSNVGMKVSSAADFSTPVGVLPLPYGHTYSWVLAY